MELEQYHHLPDPQCWSSLDNHVRAVLPAPRPTVLVTLDNHVKAVLLAPRLTVLVIS